MTRVLKGANANGGQGERQQGLGQPQSQVRGYQNPAFSQDAEESNGQGSNSVRTSNNTKEAFADVKTSQPAAETEKNAQNDGTIKRNPIVKLIQSHYRTNPVQKSEAQIQREKYLLPCGLIKFNRWFLFPAAITIQFCCGSLYAWSVYNKPIDILIYGEVVNMTPITFYIAVGCFGISAAIMGPWLERNGPLKACLLGTCLFFTGNMLTSLALFLKQIWLVFLGYGVISGFGIGLCYISPVSALQKWFPDKRGLASGFAVCGFGAGSIVFAKVEHILIINIGLPFTFLTLGCIFFIMMLISAMVIRTPPPGFTVDTNKVFVIAAEAGISVAAETNGVKPAVSGDTEDVTAESPAPPTMTLLEAITSKTYRLMYMMFFVDTLFGLVVISRLSNMITDIFNKSPEEGSTIVSINGGFNLGGRLIFSILSDFIGRKNCFVIMLTIQLIILASFSFITNSRTYWAFLLTMFCLTSCYGAGFGVIPAFLTDKFGSTNIGACHGIILTAWSVAGVAGGLLFTAIFDKIIKDGISTAKEPFPYNLNVWWIFGVVFIGWITTLCIEPTKQDAKFLIKLKSYCCCCWKKKNLNSKVQGNNGQ